MLPVPLIIDNTVSDLGCVQLFLTKLGNSNNYTQIKKQSTIVNTCGSDIKKTNLWIIGFVQSKINAEFLYVSFQLLNVVRLIVLGFSLLYKNQFFLSLAMIGIVRLALILFKSMSSATLFIFS